MQTASCKSILKEKIPVPVSEEQCFSPVFTNSIAWGNWLHVNGGLGLLLFKDINYFVRKHVQPLTKSHYGASLQVSSLWSAPIRHPKEFMVFATFQICPTWGSNLLPFKTPKKSYRCLCNRVRFYKFGVFFWSCFQKTQEDRLGWNTAFQFLKFYLGLTLSNKISSRQKKILDFFTGLIWNPFLSHSCSWRSPLISDQLSSELCKNLIFPGFWDTRFSIRFPKHWDLCSDVGHFIPQI